ncbi:hypothetical protein [Nannocystis radixulma]|uniref:Uncharacterized protein n=1 Tax=Nannocystis radixulma TaxID=2995305 RepID=A0ABT5BMH9_9BACT|nr:hypothetical protein [Nannocystis radixulma]MDC0674770.1 hypothetical protein [Nannocystis radixulma]
MVEQGGQLSAVSDGAPVQTRAGAWRLCLPESLPATEEALDGQPTIDTIALRFRVSSDEETGALALPPTEVGREPGRRPVRAKSRRRDAPIDADAVETSAPM